MGVPEIAVHEVERNGLGVILKILAEGVRQPREPARRYPHRWVLALHVGRGDVLRIGIARHRLDLAADARGRLSRVSLPASSA